MSSEWQTVSAKRNNGANGGGVWGASEPLTKVVAAQIGNSSGGKYQPPARRAPKEQTYDEMFAVALPSTSAPKLVQKQPLTGATPLSDLVKARAAAEELERKEAQARLEAEAEDRPVNDFMADQISMLRTGVPVHVLSIPGRFMAAAAARQEREAIERYERQWGDIAPYYEAPQPQEQDLDQEYDFDDRFSESSSEEHVEYEDHDNGY